MSYVAWQTKKVIYQMHIDMLNLHNKNPAIYLKQGSKNHVSLKNNFFT